MTAPLQPSAPGQDRLPFLDVLRGVAAMAVVIEHGLAVCIPGYLDLSIVWLGQAALLVVGVAYPLLSGHRFPGGYAFLFLTMFVGTMFHRYATRQTARAHLAAMLSVLAPMALAVSYVCFAVFPRDGYP